MNIKFLETVGALDDDALIEMYKNLGEASD